MDALKGMPKDPRLLAKVLSLMRKASKISEGAPKQIQIDKIFISHVGIDLENNAAAGNDHGDEELLKEIELRIVCKDLATANFIYQFAEFQDIFPMFLNRLYENPDMFLALISQVKKKEDLPDISEEDLQKALSALGKQANE